jgi:hypothetical protein
MPSTTSKVDRKEAAREFKERKPVPGIYEHRSTVTGHFWVDSSTNVHAAQNGQLFQLRQRLHRNKDLQAEWNKHGEQTFEFNVLETIPDDTPELLLRDLLAERKKLWSDRA